MIDVLVRAGALNGEGPTWNVGDQRLYWVDVRLPALHVCDPVSRTNRVWRMPAWIGCLGLTSTGAIVALRTGLFDFDLATGSLSQLAPPPFDPRRFLFNDGRCDHQGRFCVGPMYLPLDGDEEADAKRPTTAPLWRFDPIGLTPWKPASAPVHTANGLAWSPDGKTRYRSDTRIRTIWAAEYDTESGEAENERVFARVELPNSEGGPDGASVDAEGYYWSAIFGHGCLLRFDPTGRLERRVTLPVTYPTMLAFGGPDLKTIFITSANYPLTEQERATRPDDGSILVMDAPTRGVPQAKFEPHPKQSRSQ